MDYTIHWPELWSVDFTAAAEDNFFLRAVDASSASLQTVQLASVWITSVTWSNWPTLDRVAISASVVVYVTNGLALDGYLTELRSFRALG